MLFLLFQLDTDRYALPARDVTEVLPLVSTKTLPGAPTGIVGLIDYRGRAVPAVDLAAMVLGRPSARRVSTRILIVNYPLPNGGERLLAIIVERATKTFEKQPGEFQPIGIAGGTARYLGPIAHDPDGMIQRVDVGSLLTDELRLALYPPEVVRTQTAAASVP